MNTLAQAWMEWLSIKKKKKEIKVTPNFKGVIYNLVKTQNAMD